MKINMAALTKEYDQKPNGHYPIDGGLLVVDSTALVPIPSEGGYGWESELHTYSFIPTKPD